MIKRIFLTIPLLCLLIPLTFINALINIYNYILFGSEFIIYREKMDKKEAAKNRETIKRMEKFLDFFERNQK